MTTIMSYPADASQLSNDVYAAAYDVPPCPREIQDTPATRTARCDPMTPRCAELTRLAVARCVALTLATCNVSQSVR